MPHPLLWYLEVSYIFLISSPKSSVRLLWVFLFKKHLHTTISCPCNVTWIQLHNVTGISILNLGGNIYRFSKYWKDPESQLLFTLTVIPSLHMSNNRQQNTLRERIFKCNFLLPENSFTMTFCSQDVWIKRRGCKSTSCTYVMLCPNKLRTIAFLIDLIVFFRYDKKRKIYPLTMSIIFVGVVFYTTLGGRI